MLVDQFIAPAGTTVVSVALAGSGVVATLRSITTTSDLICPHCREPRSANGTRTVTLHDIPIGGHPVVVRWKRQRYRCRSGCGRASEEDRNPAFDERHRLTHRLIDWIAAQGIKETFVALAKQTGTTETLIRRVFRAAVASQAGAPRHGVKFLAIEQVLLAGRYRPALIDVVKKTFVDVCASCEELKYSLTLARIGGVPQFDDTKVVVLDISLVDWITLFPTAEVAIGKSSLVREGVRLMSEACAPLFALCAEKTKMSEKFVRVLFSRRRHELRRSARRRLAHWENELHLAYDLKEKYVDIWTDGVGDIVHDWPDWKAQIDPQHIYWPVVSLIETHRKHIVNYYSYPELAWFATWVAEASKIEAQHTHSFSAARVALLAKHQNDGLLSGQ